MIKKLKDRIQKYMRRDRFKEYRDRNFFAVLEMSREIKKKIQTLDSGSCELGKPLSPFLLYHAPRIARYRLCKERLDANMVYVYIFFAFCIATPAIFSDDFLASFTDSFHGVVFLLLVVNTFLIIFAVSSFVKLFPNNISGPFFLGIVICSLSSVFLIFISNQVGDFFIQFIISTLGLSFGVVAVMLLLIPITALIGVGVKKIANLWFSVREPETVIIDELLETLAILELGERIWLQFSKKNLICRHLENVALCVEIRMTRRAKTRDVVSSFAYSQSNEEIAAAIREKKRWILTPKQDTYQHLQSNLSRLFSQALSGDWDSMSRSQPVEIDKTKLMERLFGHFQTLVIGAIPLGMLRVVTPYIVVLQDESVQGIARLIFISWALWQIMKIFDPIINEDVSQFVDTVKNILAWRR